MRDDVSSVLVPFVIGDVVTAMPSTSESTHVGAVAVGMLSAFIVSVFSKQGKSTTVILALGASLASLAIMGVEGLVREVQAPVSLYE